MFFIFLFTFFMAGTQVAAGDWLGNFLQPAGHSVRVCVDFGPAGRAAVEREVQTRGYATPKEVLKKVLPVEEGKVCSSSREVKGIDGILTDPARSLWWHVEVNGSQAVSPYKTRLRRGDLVEWIYEEEKS